MIWELNSTYRSVCKLIHDNRKDGTTQSSGDESHTYTGWFVSENTIRGDPEFTESILMNDHFISMIRATDNRWMIENVIMPVYHTGHLFRPDSTNLTSDNIKEINADLKRCHLVHVIRSK